MCKLWDGVFKNELWGKFACFVARLGKGNREQDNCQKTFRGRFIPKEDELFQTCLAIFCK
jgi:hypothetical protein